jgi:hypothetical protein
MAEIMKQQGSGPARRLKMAAINNDASCALALGFLACMYAYVSIGAYGKL